MKKLMRSLQAKSKLKKLAKSQSGQLTLEFMMALVLVVAVSTLLGIVSFTLSLTEILQYVTFAGARSYFAGDVNIDSQVAAGNQKAQQLLTTLPFLSGAQASGWIKVATRGKASQDYKNSYAQTIGAETFRSQFDGYQLDLTVPMLNVHIPIIKDVITPPNGADFKTTISSFLTREPTFQECQAYLATAVKVLLQKYNFQTSTDIPIIIDNGC